MPLYEFQCHKCETRFEWLVRHDLESESEQIRCPRCSSHEWERQLSVAAKPQGRSRSLPVAAERADSCGMPRCCGGGCQLD